MLEVAQLHWGPFWLMKVIDNSRKSSFPGNVEAESRLGGNEE